MSKKFKKDEEYLTQAADGRYSDALFDIQKNDDIKLLTKKELSDFLNVSIKMIDRKVYMNEIPYLKIGRLVRFSKKKVLAWAEKAS